MSNIVVRLATRDDALELYRLNEEFNGNGLNTVNMIEESLATNKQEIVCLAEYKGKAVGFCCGIIKKSMCYETDTAELTELYIAEEYRRKGVATKLIQFIEKVCIDTYKVHAFTLLTGQRNLNAQALYKAAGYSIKDEILFKKRV